jgi:hypothetical protein
MRFASWSWTWVGLLWLCGVTGCATRDSGYKISNDTVAFIQPGTTTRAEVIENLGPPLFELNDLHVSAYSWGKMRLTSGGKPVSSEGMDPRQMGYSTGPSPSDTGPMVESRRWLYCIAYDDQGKVTRLERIKLEGAPSLEAALRDWAGRR